MHYVFIVLLVHNMCKDVPLVQQHIVNHYYCLLFSSCDEELIGVIKSPCWALKKFGA